MVGKQNRRMRKGQTEEGERCHTPQSGIYEKGWAHTILRSPTEKSLEQSRGGNILIPISSKTGFADSHRSYWANYFFCYTIQMTKIYSQINRILRIGKLQNDFSTPLPRRFYPIVNKTMKVESTRGQVRPPWRSQNEASYVLDNQIVLWVGRVMSRGTMPSIYLQTEWLVVVYGITTCGSWGNPHNSESDVVKAGIHPWRVLAAQ